MAKQNFLSGGYYGKLGATVGQRWKNLRTIRTYVVPNNPRTPVQQANRGLFGSCVPYAQLALALNYISAAFDSDSMSRWNMRMKTVRAYKDLGLTELNLIPLYPRGFSLPYIINSVTLTEQISPEEYVFTVTGSLPALGRVYSIVFLLPGEEDFFDRLIVCVGKSSDESPEKIQVNIPADVAITSETYCRIISNDESNSSVDMVASVQLPVRVGSPETRTFDTSVSQTLREGSQWTFVFGEDYLAGTPTIGDVSIYCVVNGARTTVSLSDCSLIRYGDKFALTGSYAQSDAQLIPAVPVGSRLNISSIGLSSPMLILNGSDIATPISNNDLERSVTVSPRAVQLNASDWRVAWDLGGTLEVSSAPASVTWKHNQEIKFRTETEASVFSGVGNQVLLYNVAYTGTPCMCPGSYIEFAQDVVVTAASVNYRISAGRKALTCTRPVTLTSDKTRYYVTLDSESFGLEFTTPGATDNPAGSYVVSAGRSGYVEMSGEGLSTDGEWSLAYVDITTGEASVYINADFSPNAVETFSDGEADLTPDGGKLVITLAGGYTWEVGALAGLPGESSE